ncbi:MAG: hypothetical protein AAF950_07180 [Pseudomonadota bacterium]
MKFRLTYEGKLLGASRNSPRAAHKNDIRLQLHPQLKRLWQANAWLKDLAGLKFPKFAEAVKGQTLRNPGHWDNCQTYSELLPLHHRHHGQMWSPLIRQEMQLSCAVDILFLREGARGGILNVGDIDGRLKTLFDALAIPRSPAGLPEPRPKDSIYVLLGDDSLISRVSVETDELLQPTSSNVGQNDSRLVITVNITPMIANYFTLGFTGD